MKTTKIIYWIATAIISVMMLFSAYQYLANPMIAQAFHHLGYPDYFRIELAFAKIIGAIILFVPMVGARIKEWTYAGFTITFISAFIAHMYANDAINYKMAPLVFLIVLIISYATYHKLHSKRLNAATA
jgi:hypothetical protein